MTSFTVYGLSGHELMPLDKVFNKPMVMKTEAIAASPHVNNMEYPDGSGQYRRQHAAEQTYRAIEQLPQHSSVVLAEQVMVSPVISLTPEIKISEVLKLFQTNAFRHVPVVSSVGRLVGIVSDRDILRYLAGVTEHYQQQIPHTNNAQVVQLMTPRVLTASVDTDVRYIARLFVEQRIGALPVAKDGELKGIITRSDVLKAVMRHYGLELWV